MKIPFFGKKQTTDDRRQTLETAPATDASSPIVEPGNVPAVGQTPLSSSVSHLASSSQTPQAAPPKKQGFFAKRAAVQTYNEQYEQGLVNVLDYIAPAAFVVTPQYIQLENMYIKTMFVYSYGASANTNWLSGVVNLDIQADISMFIYPLETAAVLEQLKRQVGNLGSTQSIQQEKGQVRDPQLQTAISDIEALRDALSRGEDRLFQYGLYFTLYSTKLDELNQLCKQLEAKLGGLLIYTKQTFMQMEQGFSASLPLGNDELLINRHMDTAALSTTFPFVSSELTNNDGILYGVNLHNTSLVLFDRFTLENANSVVFATSGAGKSFAVKLEALRSLMWGTDVIVIDPENEYERLSAAVGGSYLNLSLNSNERINPFDLPKASADERGDDILRSAVVSIKNLVAIMVGGLAPEEDAVLDKGVYEAYALRDITGDAATHRNDPPLMSDLQNVLANMSGAESLVRRLSKYTEGTFAGLFNQPTNINLDTGFVVFSIRDLEEQLRPIGMFLILSFIWNQARFQMRKRMVVVDEAWILMRYKDSSDFLYALAKRARKYYLGLTIITTDVEDFIGSQQGRTIVNNSAMRLLLRQSPSAVDKLAEVFKLTESEKLILREAKVGQGIFFAGANHVAIEIIPSFEEEQLITTNPAELMQIRKAEQDRLNAAPLPGQGGTNTAKPAIGPPSEAAASAGQPPSTNPQPPEQSKTPISPPPITSTQGYTPQFNQPVGDKPNLQPPVVMPPQQQPPRR